MVMRISSYGASLRHCGPPQTLPAPGARPVPQGPICSQSTVEGPGFPGLSSGQVSRAYPASGHLPDPPARILEPSPHGWAQKGQTQTWPARWGQRHKVLSSLGLQFQACAPSANLTLSPRTLPTSRKNRACFELEIGGVSCFMLLRHRLWDCNPNKSYAC